MVCIAAFIILIVIGIFVAFISIFKRDLGKKYLKVLKKSWHCFTRHITFRKCDTSFQDDVKAVLLKKVALKKPKAVKPLSRVIEIASVLIVVITVWSLVEGVKAGLALWALGTCNVSHPASCALGAESCSIDEENLNWFSEWGEIFAAIPDRLKNWNASDYLITPIETINELSGQKNDEDNIPAALDIMDPGCTVCLSSFRNQLKDAEFLKKHKVYIMLYVIEVDGAPKFKNSPIITNYYYALLLMSADQDGAAYHNLSLKLINQIYTGQNTSGQNYQYLFDNEYDEETAEKTIKSWLKEWGLSDAQIKSVAEKAKSTGVSDNIKKIREVVENQIKPKGIPTMIYDGNKHLGLYK